MDAKNKHTGLRATVCCDRTAPRHAARRRTTPVGHNQMRRKPEDRDRAWYTTRTTTPIIATANLLRLSPITPVAPKPSKSPVADCSADSKQNIYNDALSSPIDDLDGNEAVAPSSRVWSKESAASVRWHTYHGVLSGIGRAWLQLALTPDINERPMAGYHPRNGSPVAPRLATGGIEPPTHPFSVRGPWFWGLINQSLVALASRRLAAVCVLARSPG